MSTITSASHLPHAKPEPPAGSIYRRPSHFDPSLNGVKLAPPLEELELEGVIPGKRFPGQDPASIPPTLYILRVTPEPLPAGVPSASIRSHNLRAPYKVKRSYADLCDFDQALRRLTTRLAPHYISPVPPLTGRYILDLEEGSPHFEERTREVQDYVGCIRFLPAWGLESELLRGFLGLWPTDLEEAKDKRDEVGEGKEGVRVMTIDPSPESKSERSMTLPSPTTTSSSLDSDLPQGQHPDPPSASNPLSLSIPQNQGSPSSRRRRIRSPTSLTLSSHIIEETGKATRVSLATGEGLRMAKVMHHVASGPTESGTPSSKSWANRPVSAMLPSLSHPSSPSPLLPPGRTSHSRNQSAQGKDTISPSSSHLISSLERSSPPSKPHKKKGHGLGPGSGPPPHSLSSSPSTGMMGGSNGGHRPHPPPVNSLGRIPCLPDLELNPRAWPSSWKLYSQGHTSQSAAGKKSSGDRLHHHHHHPPSASISSRYPRRASVCASSPISSPSLPSPSSPLYSPSSLASPTLSALPMISRRGSESIAFSSSSSSSSPSSPSSPSSSSGSRVRVFDRLWKPRSKPSLLHPIAQDSELIRPHTADPSSPSSSSSLISSSFPSLPAVDDGTRMVRVVMDRARHITLRVPVTSSLEAVRERIIHKCTLAGSDMSNSEDRMLVWKDDLGDVVGLRSDHQLSLLLQGLWSQLTQSPSSIAPSPSSRTFVTLHWV
ncbi:MAG: hypothetical protein DHS80DRAFT_32289 [Piptocephalis tieghemiana]|nr:MAG: hypothetical protein DHS80DRAFT_32289 [Piptocephalis tieghemiana]